MSLLDYLVYMVHLLLLSRVSCNRFLSLTKKKEGNGQRPAVLMLLIAFTECDIFVWMVSTF